MLATLNHPHIGAIYGLEEADGVRGLVLELVEGATLAERLALGPAADPGGARRRAPDRRRARSRAREGHHPPRSEAGEHQDHIRRHGQGARLRAGQGLCDGRTREATSRRRCRSAPTASREGVIAGHGRLHESRAGARQDGRQADRHLGVRLRAVRDADRAGRRFAARPPPTRSPRSSNTSPTGALLPADTPPGIRRLLQRCLEKDPKRRLRDIGDARLEIEEATQRRCGANDAGGCRPAIPTASVPARIRLAWWAAAAAGVLVIAAAATWQLQRSEYFWRNPLEGASVTQADRFRGRGTSRRDFARREVRRLSIRPQWIVERLGEPGRDRRHLQPHQGQRAGAAESRHSYSRVQPGRNAGHPVAPRAGFRRGRLVNAGWAVPTLGGPLRPYLKDISDISELDWSPDGRLIVYHPPSDGDPLFVIEPDENGRTAEDLRGAERLPQPLSRLVGRRRVHLLRARPACSRKATSGASARRAASPNG